MEITRRHDILRTTFTEVEGELLQVVGPVVAVPLPVVDLQALPAHRRETQIRELAREDVQQAFDLTRGPLLRAQLLRLEAEAHVLLLTIHHIVFDDWSQGVFWRELATLYQAFLRGGASPLPELSIQYADAAHWHRQGLEDDGGTAARLLERSTRGGRAAGNSDRSPASGGSNIPGGSSPPHLVV